MLGYVITDILPHLFESTTIVIGRTCDGDSVSTGKMGCRMERNKLALFS